MSADYSGKSPKKPTTDVYKQLEDGEIDPSRAMRTLRRELPWKDWLLLDFLRYWYWLGVVTLEVFLILDLKYTYHVRDILGMVLIGFMAGFILGLGYFGYKVLWPEGGFTRSEMMRKTLRRLRWKRKRFE